MSIVIINCFVNVRSQNIFCIFKIHECTVKCIFELYVLEIFKYSAVFCIFQHRSNVFCAKNTLYWIYFLVVITSVFFFFSFFNRFQRATNFDWFFQQFHISKFIAMYKYGRLSISGKRRDIKNNFEIASFRDNKIVTKT